MPLSDAFVADAAAHSDLALIVLGRTAGEDRDNTLQEGSYYLTQAERKMLKIVCAAFSRTVVVLNVGNIMDMSWVDDYRPSSVLYVWQGGMEGGCGAADILCGLSPSGRLTDTIAFDYSDYPSSRNFGSTKENFYAEDIYVGYRYFETFAKDRVRYPFGFGLSYTTFSAQHAMSEAPDHLTVTAAITNTGTTAGKEVVQVYAEAPQGLLGKPSRVLCAFAKTGTLQPGCTETLELTIPKSALASYDDSGVTGHKSCFVLEAGTYTLYAGCDVRSAAPVGSFFHCRNARNRSIDRMHGSGKGVFAYEAGCRNAGYCFCRLRNRPSVQGFLRPCPDTHDQSDGQARCIPSGLSALYRRYRHTAFRCKGWTRGLCPFSCTAYR